MEGERSKAFICVIFMFEEGGRRGVGERSLRVFRPVPAPSSVMVIESGVVVGVELDRRENVFVRRVGRRRSSRAWRMLPSVS